MCTLFCVEPAYAYVPEFTNQPTLHDTTLIATPHLSQVYFGELTGMPHTYEISVRESFTLSIELRTLQVASHVSDVSGIVIKVPRKGRVEEVVRLSGGDVVWEEREDTLTGDTYLAGATFSKELDPGTYRIEVHTPNNVEKYMLAIGTTEEMTLGYFELIHRLLKIKDFYGTSRMLIILSPFLYWPLVGIIVVVISVWYGRQLICVNRIAST